MKSPHLWLSAALIACGLFSPVRADDLASQNRTSSWKISTASLSPRSWFRAPLAADVVFRAQSEENVPVPNDTTVVPEAAGDPAVSVDAGTAPLTLQEPTTWNAFSPPATSDPFLEGGVVQPYAPAAPMAPGYGVPAPAPGVYQSYGVNGGRPYRFGVEQSLDMYLIPSADVSGGGAAGKYEELGVDYRLRWTRPFMPGWILKETGQISWRAWDGPVGGAGLPGSAFRFGADFQIENPAPSPWNVELGITPSFNSDLEDSASSKAFQLDGRGIIWWQMNHAWRFGLGAQYWDRVEDRVIPYAGWHYRDDFWEWRLMFPESEIRLFLGNDRWWSQWIYLRGKYNVEAFEVTTVGGVRDEVEFRDWQLTLGLQTDTGMSRWFIEGGLVLDREINYGSSPDVDVDTSYITRFGVRY